MNGLLVWAHSHCRSTLAFYEGLAKAFGVPLKVLFWIRDTSNRVVVGYSDEEFSHLDTLFVEDDIDLAKKELAAHRAWHHLFGTYQRGTVLEKCCWRREGGAALSPSDQKHPVICGSRHARFSRTSTYQRSYAMWFPNKSKLLTLFSTCRAMSTRTCKEWGGPPGRLSGVGITRRLWSVVRSR